MKTIGEPVNPTEEAAAFAKAFGTAKDTSLDEEELAVEKFDDPTTSITAGDT